jgi:hypothetical protein
MELNATLLAKNLNTLASLFLAQIVLQTVLLLQCVMALEPALVYNQLPQLSTLLQVIAPHTLQPLTVPPTVPLITILNHLL